MNRTRIKICGMTNADDANFAAQLGVDAIGLIFYAPSKRAVTIEQAQFIAQQLPPFVSKVGVFVDPTAEFLQQILNYVSLDYLQFHGEESFKFCSSFKLPYIKTIHVKNEVVTEDYEKQYPNAAGFLFDTFQKDLKGGTGKVFDWQMLPKNPQKPFLLSGGLTPENVVVAIKQLGPYGVDVTSGVEATPGIKDKTKMLAFIENVQRTTTRV